jgi:hypothetical protein
MKHLEILLLGLFVCVSIALVPVAIIGPNYLAWSTGNDWWNLLYIFPVGLFAYMAGLVVKGTSGSSGA